MQWFLKLPTYWIPQAKVWLLSTTSLLQTYDKEKIVCKPHFIKLTSDPTKGAVVVNIDPTNKLPKTLAYQWSAPALAAEELSSTITEVHCSVYNISELEMESLHWHQFLGHLSMKRVQFLIRIWVLSCAGATQHLHTAACKINTHPSVQHASLCSANLFNNLLLYAINLGHATRSADYSIVCFWFGEASTSVVLWWSFHLHWFSSSSFFQSGSLWSRHLDLWWSHGWSQ